MSLAIIHSRALLGLKSPLITVETHLSRGLPRFSIVGLPEAAVKESKERVRSAILNSGFKFPGGRITVNLAPADLPKEGTRLDLPIALSILAAFKQISSDSLMQYEFAGELALSGELRPVRGILPFALETQIAKRGLIIPFQNADEAILIKTLSVFPAHHLIEVCQHLCGEKLLLPYTKNLSTSYEETLDLIEVRGQIAAKRALEIAAAGYHSLLFIGPPGTGKTMLAMRLSSILPPMTDQEAIEAAAMASISHQGFQVKHFGRRPFRSPHHSASSIALVGGGNPPKPGEISLAHHGILFLDELTEFNRHVLEALREPLESHVITISRAARQNEFPARFQLIAAMNPCLCGYLGDVEKTCTCSAKQIQQYRTKISGPFLDRMDMLTDVSRLPAHLLTSQNYSGESSQTIQQRVITAREKQLNRSQKLNSQLTQKEIQQYCPLGSTEQNLLNECIKQSKISARSYYRILKIARTIADLAHSENIAIAHLAEAIGYKKQEL